MTQLLGRLTCGVWTEGKIGRINEKVRLAHDWDGYFEVEMQREEGKMERNPWSLVYGAKDRKDEKDKPIKRCVVSYVKDSFI